MRPVFLLIFAALAAVSLLPDVASAQSRADGSVYGGFGIGERRSIFTSQAEGMGVIGVGLFSPGYLNVANPGAYSDQIFTRFAGGIDFAGVKSTDASNNSSTSAGGNVGAVQFGFPILHRKLGVAASYGPYTNAGYRATNIGLLEGDDPEPATAYESNLEGDGGLQEANFGIGYRIVPALSVGASASALWGITEDLVRTEYSNTTQFVLSSTQRLSTRLSGFTATFGAVARAPHLVGERDVLTVGASFTLPTTLSGARTMLVNQGLTLSDSVGASIDADVSVPMRLSAGITYAPGSKWLLIADGYFEPWSKFKSNLIFRGYHPDQPTAFNDAYRLAIGAQFLPAGSDPFAGKLARTALRLGLFTQQAYAVPQENYSLVTYGVAAGLSLPTALPGTYLDLSWQVGTRGQSEGVLVKDLLYRFSITLNFGERWFIQRRLR